MGSNDHVYHKMVSAINKSFQGLTLSSHDSDYKRKSDTKIPITFLEILPIHRFAATDQVEINIVHTFNGPKFVISKNGSFGDPDIRLAACSGAAKRVKLLYLQEWLTSLQIMESCQRRNIISPYITIVLLG